MKKKLTCSLLALSMAFNTTAVPGITKVFAQDEVIDDGVVNDNETQNDINTDDAEYQQMLDEMDAEMDAEYQAYLQELENEPSAINSLTYTVDEGTYTYTANNNTATITKFEAKAGALDGSISLEIPSTINGNSVTSIGGSAFKDCTSLTSITIPYGVTSIQGYAFKNCTKLTSIKIPDSITSIAFLAFENCPSLESINIPDGITSIGARAFENCISLASITLPDSVTSIGNLAFSGCTSLASVNIPDGVTSIGTSTFKDCTSLTSITLPDRVTSIASYAFSGCTSLASITIPDTVTSIASYAFKECTSLESITIPDGITSIEEVTFYGCTSLASVTIPDSVTKIGESVFYDCTSLVSIIIPDGVTFIGSYTFRGCTSLESIAIPDSVTFIGTSTFKDCTSLTDVYYAGSEIDWDAISISTSNTPLTNATIHYNSTMPDNGSTPPDEDDTETPDEDDTETPDSNYETDIPDYDIGDKDAGEADVAEDGHLIVIWDKNNNPVSGATVAINGKNHTAVNGKVSLTSDDLGSETTFNVVASGFQSIASEGLAQDKNISYVTMISDSSTELFTTVSFRFEDHSLNAQISGSDNMVANVFWEASPITFVANDTMYIEVEIPVTIDPSAYTYELVNGNTVVKKSNNGVFEFEVLKTKMNGYIDVFDINGLSAGDDYGVLITENATKTSTLIPTNLSVAEPNAISLLDLPKTFSFGDNISFGVAGIPIFEGAFKDISDKMDIGLPDVIPIDFEYADDLATTTLVVSVGKGLDEIFSDDINDSGKIALDEVNKKISEMETRTNSGSPKVFGQDIKYSLGPISADGSVGGIGKLVNDKYHNTWTGTLGASAEASLGASFGTTIPAWGIPITLGFDTSGNMGANGSGSLTWGKGVDNVSHELDLTIAPGITIGGGVGVGVSDIGGFGVKGDATLTHSVNLKDNAALTTLGGDIGLYAELTIFDLVDGFTGFTEFLGIDSFYGYYSLLSSQITLYDSTNRSVYAELMSINASNNSQPTLISRDYGTSTITNSNNAIKSGVLSSSRPEIINVNGTSYVFWIDDVGAGRSSANRAALFYSQYSNGSWSNPTQVVAESNDSTNDFYFDVTVDSNNKIHITWLKSNSSLSNDVTLDQMFSDFDVYYTTIDDNTIATPTKVTSNSYHDNMASISDDGSMIAWVEYSNDSSVMGILAGGVLGTIKYASTSDLTDVKTHASNVDVTSLGVIGNKIVYSSNGSVYINGSSVYSGTASSNIKTNNGTAYWIDSDSLSSEITLYSSTGSAPTTVFTGDIDSSYSITDAGPVWTSYHEGAYYFKGASDSTTSYIMDKIDATGINKTSAYSTGDTFTIAYMDTENNTIKSQNVTKAVSDISLDNIGLESYIDNKNRIVSETTSAIILDVTNHGNSNITTATLKIDGSEVKTFTGLSIAPGESITLKHDYVHGVLSGTKTFNAEITTTNDKFDDNNKNTFTLGYSNLGVTTTLSRVNSSHLAEVIVSNDMYTKTGATLNIRSHTQDGAIVFTKSISDISKGTDSISLVNLSAIEKELDSRIDVFFIELIPNGNSDFSSGNIYDVITLSSGRGTVTSNDNNDPTPDEDTTTHLNNSYFGTNNKITSVTTPNAVTLSAVATAQDSNAVLNNAQVSSSYTAKSVLGNFSLSDYKDAVKTKGITVTMDSNSGYSHFAVVHYDVSGVYQKTYGVFSNNSFTFYPESFSSFYVIGLTKSGVSTPTVSQSSNGSGSNSYSSANTYSYGSISIPSLGYIPEFRNILLGELINLDKITINDMEILGWYYDAEFTREVENTSMFVVTQDIIDNGLYPKFKTIVSDTLIDGSTNAGFVDTQTNTNTTFVPTPVPTTFKKLLNKLF